MSTRNTIPPLELIQPGDGSGKTRNTINYIISNYPTIIEMIEESTSLFEPIPGATTTSVINNVYNVYNEKLTSLEEGTRIVIGPFDKSNTNDSPSLKLNEFAVYPIVNWNYEAYAGMIPPGMTLDLRFDGSKWVIQNNSTIYRVYETIMSTLSTTTTYTATIPSASVIPNSIFSLTFPQSNSTTKVIISINNGVLPIKGELLYQGKPLAINQLEAGSTSFVMYTKDKTFELISPAISADTLYMKSYNEDTTEQTTTKLTTKTTISDSIEYLENRINNLSGMSIGRSWSIFPSNITINGNIVSSAYGNGVIVILTSIGYIYRSIDNGTSFKTHQLLNSASYTSLIYDTNSKVFAYTRNASGNGYIGISRDGITFTETQTNGTEFAQIISGLDSVGTRLMVGLGTNGSILVSTNWTTDSITWDSIYTISQILSTGDKIIKLFYDESTMSFIYLTEKSRNINMQLAGASPYQISGAIGRLSWRISSSNKPTVSEITIHTNELSNITASGTDSIYDIAIDNGTVVCIMGSYTIVGNRNNVFNIVDYYKYHATAYDNELYSTWNLCGYNSGVFVAFKNTGSFRIKTSTSYGSNWLLRDIDTISTINILTILSIKGALMAFGTNSSGTLTRILSGNIELDSAVGGYIIDSNVTENSDEITNTIWPADKVIEELNKKTDITESIPFFNTTFNANMYTIAETFNYKNNSIILIKASGGTNTANAKLKFANDEGLNIYNFNGLVTAGEIISGGYYLLYHLNNAWYIINTRRPDKVINTTMAISANVCTYSASIADLVITDGIVLTVNFPSTNTTDSPILQINDVSGYIGRAGTGSAVANIKTNHIMANTTKTVIRSGSYWILTDQSYGSNVVLDLYSALSSGASESSVTSTMTLNTALANLQRGIDNRLKKYTSSTTGEFYSGTTTPSASTRLNYNGHLYATKFIGAVYNDIAEYRIGSSEVLPGVNKPRTFLPGIVVSEYGDGKVNICKKSHASTAMIVSDTYGFIIGDDRVGNVPVAIAGRVLAYIDRKAYPHPKVGDAVCSTKRGLIRKMKWYEKMLHPESIIGVVSEIPTYQTWGTDNVEVDGRIWISLR